MVRRDSPGNAPPELGGVPGSGAWALLVYGLLGAWKNRFPEGLPDLGGRSLVLMLREEADLEDVGDALAALRPLFPGTATPAAAVLTEDPRDALRAMEKMVSGPCVLLCTPGGLELPAPGPAEYAGMRERLRMGDSRSLTATARRLAELGYRRVPFVESPGEFSVRGAVVDFFPPASAGAARLLFNESALESVRSLDTETQSGGNFLDEAWLLPALAKPEAGRMRDWLSEEAGGRRGFWIVQEGLRPPSGRAADRVVGDFPRDRCWDFGARPVPRLQGNLELAAGHMLDWAGDGYQVCLFSINRGEDERVQELLEGRIPEGACQFLIGPLRSGFLHAGLRLAVLTASELFERHYRPSPRGEGAASAGRRRARPADLKPGDYVVHQDYGIARYQGIKPVSAPGHGTTDCLLLEYRSSDRLYVPMHEFRRVQKYVGSQGQRPRLSSLDTRSWEEVQARVREGVRELARELLRLEALRSARPGHAFPEDSRLEAEFADAFPYEETRDQRRAIEEVKADMVSPLPMDRLVVGDVGFGKTEVAMRAAFKCVCGSKQAAVLVPTTILADQHFRTFAARFAEYPVRVSLLSRFQTPARQRRTLQGLRSGAVDVVIGTQRLLSEDVAFKDLGLLVIDEEHRFGVKDKERLKAIRQDVDALSLSATPIPRTLYQALSGLRKISLIRSAPTGRQPIATVVLPWSEAAVVAAVRRELVRGGQAYYVHNRVGGLEGKLSELRRLLPEARFAMVHGQMRGADIEEAMWRFFQREFDVLLASSIIESGLDIPSVNTLLVENAQDFGLAQLYQLRGRIGRERQKAVCHLFYPGGMEDEAGLSEEARKRLKALKEFGELGSGFHLAVRDLEIRGGGELLGAKQHGFVNAVGVEYYGELLQEEVARLQGRPAPVKRPPVHLDLRLAAYLPEEFLPDDLERLGFYKRLLAASPDELPRLRRELEDLCGPLPEPAADLFRLMSLRCEAERAGVREAAQREEGLEVHFLPDASVPRRAVEGWFREYPGRVEFIRSPEGDGVRIRADAGDPIAWLEGFLKGLSG